MTFFCVYFLKLLQVLWKLEGLSVDLMELMEVSIESGRHRDLANMGFEWRVDCSSELRVISGKNWRRTLPQR